RVRAGPSRPDRPPGLSRGDLGYRGGGGLLVRVGASYDCGRSGATHRAPADVQALGGIPGIEVLLPGTPREAAELIGRTYANGRPTYLRTCVAENDRAVELAPAGLTLVRRGPEATVVVAGPFLSRTLSALVGIVATVLYATTLVPLDQDTLAREAAAAPEVILVEPTYEGTTAAQVAAALSHRPTRLLSIGVHRRFIHRYGTSAEHDR